MAIDNWEYGDNFGPLTDIVNEVVNTSNSCLDLSSLSKFDILQEDTNVYDSKTLPTNWENFNDKVVACRRGKTVEMMVYISADWISGFSTAFAPEFVLKDMYKGLENSLVMGTFMISKQSTGATVYFALNPNGSYVNFDSSGNLQFLLEDGLMPGSDSAIMSIHFTYQAKNDISAFL